MLLRIFYTILFSIYSLVVVAQVIDENDFSRYSLKEGLSDNYVSGIVQDANGYIWISTRRGLNRFDGKHFRQFYSNDKYNPIPDNGIYSMKLLGLDELAIATEDGAQIISTKTLKQLDLSIKNDDQLRYWSNACMSVLKDADGNYGVSTKTGYYIFSSLGIMKKRFDYYTRKDIGEWMLFGDDLYPSPDGNMMQLNKDGLLLYNRQENQITNAVNKYASLKELVKEKNNNLFFPISKSELVHININTNSFDLIDIRSGKIASFPSCVNFLDNISWMTVPSKINDTTWAINCQTKGFFLITMNPEKKSFSCNPTRYFPDKQCTVILADQNHTLWIGTTEGLYKQNSYPKITESFSIPDEEIGDMNITALHITKNKIFAGTNRNKILVMDKYSKKITNTIQLPITTDRSNNVRCFTYFNPDTLWVGTSSGLFWINDRNYSHGIIEIEKDLNPPLIYLLFPDKKNNIWLSSSSTNIVYYYDKQAKSFQKIDDSAHPQFKTAVTSITEDKFGNIWMAGDAIIRWNPAKKKIDQLIERIPSQQNLKKGYTVMADSKGEIWSTINDDGMVKLTGIPRHFRPKNLTRDRSSFIKPELLNDKIFIFTTKGLGYFDINNLKGVSFNDLDGIPLKPVSTYMFVKDDADGSIWFAFKNVISRIPSHPPTDLIKPPILNITALSILEDTVLNYPSKKIDLNYKQADVNIFYSAINYTDPENMQFAYRIKNKKDSSWIEAGDQQNILLTNISPGNYNIELKVSAFDNKWQEQITELEIEIKPPFWDTALFYISLAIMFVLSVIFIYRYRIRQINQKANLDKQLAQTEMKALHAQMNPHFIFNCLNSIREMILDNENKQASLYLSKFARLIRITLNQSSKSFVSLTDTIDYLARYIEIEKIRSNHFTYWIDVCEDLPTDDIMLPPMLIQPFLENAIWHGMIPNKEMEVYASFHKTENELICVIEDNGMGIEASLKMKTNTLDDMPVGIANIQQRIALLNEKYKLRSTINIVDKSTLQSNTGTGTVVTIHLPLNIN